MSGRDADVVARLAEQRDHQIRVAEARRPWWITGLFLLGACVSILGLKLSFQTLPQDGLTFRIIGFGVFTILFGWAVVLGLTARLWIKPRIVPYFRRELGPYGGPTMVPFRRGRALYREFAALERLARTLDITPLSAFGFAYDHYEQEVRWHAAGAALRTVEALRRALAMDRVTGPEAMEDLDALAAVLGTAMEQRVDVCFVLRLHARESMQAVCTRELRQGAFW